MVGLDEGKLLYDYTKAFKILAQAVKDTNCSKVDKIDKFESESFEHQEKSDVTGQKGSLLPSRPIWLRNPSINLTDAFNCILKAFQNPVWAEQARERLKQIHTLTHVVTV